MTPKEYTEFVQRSKMRLESEIAAALALFAKETGLEVDWISLDARVRNDSGVPIEYKVRADVKLPEA